MSKWLAAVVLLAATAASAQSLVATSPGPAGPPPGRVVDGRLGMMLGGAQVGDTAGFSPGIAAGAGYRIGDLTLRGQFDYYKVGDSADAAVQRRGRATRVGGALRYSFANTGPVNSVDVDFWGELGAGYEHVDWRTGGVLDRPDGELAFGLDVGGRGDERHGRRREIGYFMAFRTLLGEAPDMAQAMVTCGGPCSRPTTPSRIDVSMFFEFGVHWGR